MLNGGEHTPDLSQDYHFDEDHRAAPEDTARIRRELGEEFEAARDKALELRDRNPALEHLSDETALAIHANTRHEVAYRANEAFRNGEEHGGFEAANQTVRAVEGGLNELPKLDGAELVRGIRFYGNSRLIELAAGEYVPGKVTVETTMTSASIKGDGVTASKFGTDVELHIQSKTFRDVSGLSANLGEREALGKVGVQLYVHSNELVQLPEGKTRRVIHAEEVVPGDPRYLDPEATKQAMADRRQRYTEVASEFRRNSQITTGLGEVVVAPKETAPEPARPALGDVLDGKAELKAPDGYAGTGEQPEHVEISAGQTGDHDWSPLVQATHPPGEPAIHADSANANQQAKYLAERHPELAAVNPHFRDADALANGYQTNCTRGVVAYAQRLLGIDAHAEPLLPHELETKGTLDYVREQLGGQWQEHGDYDSVIRAMREQPVGSHAVIGVVYEGPDGQIHGHVAMVANTADGVAFIDPQSGALMRLPHPPLQLDLLPFGSLEHSDGMAAPSEGHMPHEFAEPAYGAAEPSHYLSEPRVAEALDRANDHHVEIDGVSVPLGDAIRELLPRHPELAELVHAHGYLENSLLARPMTLYNLLSHPEAIPVLADAVHEVHEHGPDALLADHEAAGGPEPTPLTPEQHEISHQVTEQVSDYKAVDRRQAGFDRSRQEDVAYREEYLRARYEDAKVAQRELNTVVDAIAAETGGEPGYREKPKDWARAIDKVNTYDGDVSKLTDLAGAKIQFSRVADAYRALDRLSLDPRVEILGFEDRFANPKSSGYRDLQLTVRMSNGHVSELRLHLRSIDEVAKYEHALYEVQRDLPAVARDEGRVLTAEEKALRAALTGRVRELFMTALRRGL